MIIIRTPLRISLAGGGTDLPAYSSKNGSILISAAINKYIYITKHQSLFSPKIRIRYSVMEEVDLVEEIKNEIVKETLKVCGIEGRIEITSHAEIPNGTGLGSSGSFGVGLLHSLLPKLKRNELAKIATSIQQQNLNFPIGIQDQYVAAYGGTNVYCQNQNGNISIEKIDLKKLQKRLVLFFTGFKRDANEILSKSSIEGLDEIYKLGYETLGIFKHKQFDKYGDILNRHWEYKKKRGEMTNPQIDEWYELGLKNGALGGKLVGAGGGGFLLFYTNNPEKLIKAMPLQHLPFEFDYKGSTIVLND